MDTIITKTESNIAECTVKTVVVDYYDLEAKARGAKSKPKVESQKWVVDGYTFWFENYSILQLWLNFLPSIPEHTKTTVWFVNDDAGNSFEIKKGYEHTSTYYGWIDFEEVETVQNHWLRKDGSMHLRLEIKLPRKIEYLKNYDTKHFKNFEQSFEQSFEQEYGADFKFLVEGKAINVSRAIVGPHSDVFMAMFESEFSEKKKNEAIIEDFSYEVIRALVKFTYIPKLDFTDIDFGFDLLRAADKYNIQGAKDCCKFLLARLIANETVLNILNIANSMNYADLRESCIVFLVNKSKFDMTLIPGWSEIKDIEIMRLIVEKKALKFNCA
jgi:hypothetical protein